MKLLEIFRKDAIVPSIEADERNEAIAELLDALIAGGITWSVALGIPLGCWAAVKRGSTADRIVGLLSVAVIAIPSFVIAIYSLLIFAVTLQWLPAIGAGEAGKFWDQMTHLILPSLAVGLGWVGYIARMVRASMLEVLEAQHIRTARAFGLQTMIGCMGESSVSISAGAALGALLDHIDLDSHLNLAPDPATGAQLVDGVLVPTDDPGHGARLEDA